MENEFVGRIIKAVGELEINLRNTLEKFGLQEKELKKPLNEMIGHSVEIGILSPSDVRSINQVREIRNMTAHSKRQPSERDVTYVEDVVYTLISKIKTNVHPTKKSVLLELYLEKNIFSENESIKLIGKVSNIIKKTPVSISVINPKGNIVAISQVNVDRRKNFSETFVAGGPLWQKRGTYKIRALYGSTENTTSLSFTFKKKLDFSKITKSNSYKLKKLSGQTIEIPYVIEGGSIISILPDYQSKSLILSLEALEDGELWIKLPRTVIDSRIHEKDDKYFVLINGDEVEFLERATFNEREIIIEFSKGTEEIEILGTHLFGTKEEISKNKNFVSILQGSSAPKDDENYLKPQTLIVNVGDTVTWVNEDKAAHTVTSGTPESGSSEIFDSSLFMPGREFSVKFTKKGTYRYYCIVHPWKEGKIIVT